jgi:hypothetical protein
LISPAKKRRVVNISERNRRRARMAEQNGNADGVQIVERKMSYGIGGAGNIRSSLPSLLL